MTPGRCVILSAAKDLYTVRDKQKNKKDSSGFALRMTPGRCVILRAAKDLYVVRDKQKNKKDSSGFALRMTRYEKIIKK